MSIQPVRSTGPPGILQSISNLKNTPRSVPPPSPGPADGSQKQTGETPSSGNEEQKQNSGNSNQQNKPPVIQGDSSKRSIPAGIRPTGLRPSNQQNGRGSGSGNSQSGIISRNSGDGSRPGNRSSSGSVNPGSSESGKNTRSGTSKEGSKGPGQLSEEEKEKVEKLKKRDREVRRHEQAHLAAAGPHAQGGIQYEFTTGPDGKRYAVGGSVSLDTSSEDSPEETAKKMRTVRAAALAPSDPSPSDLKVAQKAAQKLAEARRKEAKMNSKVKMEARDRNQKTWLRRIKRRKMVPNNNPRKQRAKRTRKVTVHFVPIREVENESREKRFHLSEIRRNKGTINREFPWIDSQ
ncbi:MAG: putative metalloprotease CJM1_0395 family protein [bacterium]